MTSTLQSFEALQADGLWTPASVDEQMSNILDWQQEGFIPPIANPTTDSFTALDNASPNVLVITPYLDSTHETARSLWRIIVANSGENTAVESDSVFSTDGDDAKRMYGVDEQLPSDVKTHTNERYVHKGPRVTARPTLGIAASELDLDAHLGEHNPGSGNTVAPFIVRSPGDPHVEILATLAHNPQLVEAMREKDGPWVWLPGLHVHDVKGFITARTGLLAVIGHQLRIGSVWNDSGMRSATIPKFTKYPIKS